MAEPTKPRSVRTPFPCVRARGVAIQPTHFAQPGKPRKDPNSSSTKKGGHIGLEMNCCGIPRMVILSRCKRGRPWGEIGVVSWWSWGTQPAKTRLLFAVCSASLCPSGPVLQLLAAHARSQTSVFSQRHATRDGVFFSCSYCSTCLTLEPFFFTCLPPGVRPVVLVMWVFQGWHVTPDNTANDEFMVP